MPVFQLAKDSYWFPYPTLADLDGLLAFGGDLSIPRLLNAYSNGIFPWYNPGEEILWWCPHNRFVIFPKEIHISRSMKKKMRKNNYEIKINTDFSQIIKKCRNSRDESWITDEMEAAYNELFNFGYIMCVGIYENEVLVGGIYGVIIGKCFFGESMFSHTNNASKIALINLCKILSEKNFAFVDCQFHTEHLESMGGRYISWNEYHKLLREGISQI